MQTYGGGESSSSSRTMNRLEGKNSREGDTMEEAECLVSSEEKKGVVKVGCTCVDEAFLEVCLLYNALFVASLLRAE